MEKGRPNSEVERCQLGRLDCPLLQTPGGLSDEDVLNNKEGFMSVYLKNSSSSSGERGNDWSKLQSKASVSIFQ